MMRRKIRFLIIILSACGLAYGTLAAQDGSTEIFAPFVSRFAATAEAARIILSWKNSEDLAGFKRIYRSPVEITEATLKDAVMIARVAPDVESYIDIPAAGQAFFYAVIIEDGSRRPYNVFIPYRNKTIAAVRVQPAVPERDTAAEITGLSAVVSSDAVTLSFVSSSKTRELILYRSTSPITGYEDLSRAAYSLLLSPGTSRQTDVPLPGINYYYAVVDSGLLNAGQAVFTLGQNSTAAPVQIPLIASVSRADTFHSRIYPLPAPHILYAVDTGEELLPPLPFLLPPRLPLAPVVQDRVDKFIQRIHRPSAARTFELLPIEQASSLEGEDKDLQTIAAAGVDAPEYKEVVDKLTAFLSAQHSGHIQARARFYLGQAYYLHGQYRKAMNEFIVAAENLYVETQPWTDACLEKMYATGK